MAVALGTNVNIQNAEEAEKRHRASQEEELKRQTAFREQMRANSVLTLSQSAVTKSRVEILATIPERLTLDIGQVDMLAREPYFGSKFLCHEGMYHDYKKGAKLYVAVKKPRNVDQVRCFSYPPSTMLLSHRIPIAIH